MKKLLPLLIYCLTTSFLFSCEPTSSPINYGQDKCDFCRMTIVDNKFAGEIVTGKGKAYKFDATECMAHFLNQQMVDETKVKMILTTGFDGQGVLKDAHTAAFLKSENMPSPMGAFLNPFHDRNSAEQEQEKNTGDILTWDQVRKELADK